MNEIFGRCLRTSTSVQLWHFYLTYIRRTNPIDRSSAERSAPARDIITEAFEFSLAHVGADLEAGPIWYDYIEFLKEGDVSGTWEAQQKMDKLRQTYQRAVCIPLSNIEQLWQGYDAFENNLNRATVSIPPSILHEDLHLPFVTPSGQEIPSRSVTCIHDSTSNSTPTPKLHGQAFLRSCSTQTELGICS